NRAADTSDFAASPAGNVTLCMSNPALFKDSLIGGSCREATCSSVTINALPPLQRCRAKAPMPAGSPLAMAMSYERSLRSTRTSQNHFRKSTRQAAKAQKTLEPSFSNACLGTPVCETLFQVGVWTRSGASRPAFPNRTTSFKDVVTAYDSVSGPH